MTHGVNLAFITSNEIYWQVRFERDSEGRARRVIVGYKDFKPDPVRNPSLRTILWRDLGRPEQELSGVQLPTNGFLDWGGLPFVPIHTHTWPFRGTGLRSGVAVPGELVGYEIDSFDPAYPAPERRVAGADRRFAVRQLRRRQRLHPQHVDLPRPLGGARVGDGHDGLVVDARTGRLERGAHNNVRPSLQRLTENVLGRMLAGGRR